MIIDNIKKIEHSLNRIFGSLASKYGLTGKQFFILGFILRESKKKEISQKDVESFGNVRKSSVSSILSNLEKNGFIERQTSVSDARMNKIVPTEKSFEIQRKLEYLKKKIENSIFVGFSKEELQKWDNSLCEIHQRLKEIAKEN